MQRRVVYEASPILVAAVGVLLFVTAATHHLLEIQSLGNASGPLVAFAVDGLPALGLVYGGYVLARRSFEPENRWLVFLGTVAGSTIVTGIIVVSIVVRLAEGRPVSEPPFQILIGATFGALAGLVAGYFYARSREQANAAVSAMSTLSFTNNVLRHDIKNDMTVIQGRANVIAEAGTEDELVAESAQTIERQVEDVLSVIDSTSAISETLSEDPNYEPVDLATLVRAEANQQAATLNVEVTTSVPETAKVSANEALRTVVTNLIENAIEHNDASEPAVHVVVESVGELVRLRVVDNGPGVPDEKKPTLFTPRPEDTGKGGLHVVATLVENFGGDIWVEDNEPRGAVFVVELPPASDDNVFVN